MSYVDVDGDPATFDSSSANLTSRRCDRALRRPLLGRRARPGRDPAAAVRPGPAAHGPCRQNPAAAGSAWLQAPRVGMSRSTRASSTPTPRTWVRAGSRRAHALPGLRRRDLARAGAAAAPTRSPTSRPAQAPTATPAGRSWSPIRTPRSPPATSRSSTASPRSRSTPMSHDGHGFKTPLTGASTRRSAWSPTRATSRSAATP